MRGFLLFSLDYKVSPRKFVYNYYLTCNRKSIQIFWDSKKCNFGQFSTSESEKYGEIFHNFFVGQGKNRFFWQNINLSLFSQKFSFRELCESCCFKIRLVVTSQIIIILYHIISDLARS